MFSHLPSLKAAQPQHKPVLWQTGNIPAACSFLSYANLGSLVTHLCKRCGAWTPGLPIRLLLQPGRQAAASHIQLFCWKGVMFCFHHTLWSNEIEAAGGERIHRTWQLKNIFCSMYKTVLNCVLSRFYTVTHFQGHQTRTCFCFITRHDPYHTQVWFSFFVL